MKSIPYGRQNITDDDIQSVITVLKSDFLTQGPKVLEFEKAFANYIGVKFAVAVSNGTAALHLCVLALDIKEGDKVITTPITFAATANCVKFCGGDVIFADIDPETYLLDICKVKELLESSPKGTYKGIIPVDFTGRAVDLKAFRKLKDDYDLWMIEDACHAPGGYFINDEGITENCGNGNYADMSIFSFHPVKHIATGEGGMITTNNEALYKKLQILRTHGIIQKQETSIKDLSPWYYEMQILGFNYRLTDFQAALGISQLKRAEQSLNRRFEIATIYNDAFRTKPYVIKQAGIIPGHAYHLYVVEFKQRKELYLHLRNNNIFTQVHYIPLHFMPYYKQFGWQEGDFPYAEKYYSQCLSLPIFPTLTNEEQHYIISCIDDFFR